MKLALSWTVAAAAASVLYVQNAYNVISVFSLPLFALVALKSVQIQNTEIAIVKDQFQMCCCMVAIVQHSSSLNYTRARWSD